MCIEKASLKLILENKKNTKDGIIACKNNKFIMRKDVIQNINGAVFFHSQALQRPEPDLTNLNVGHNYDYKPGYILAHSRNTNCMNTALIALGGSPEKRDYLPGSSLKIICRQAGLELSERRGAIVVANKENVLPEIEKDCIVIEGPIDFKRFLQHSENLFNEKKKQPTGFIIEYIKYRRDFITPASRAKHVLAIVDQKLLTKGDRKSLKNRNIITFVEGGHSDNTPITKMTIEDFLDNYTSSYQKKMNIVEVIICMIYGVRPAH